MICGGGGGAGYVVDKLRIMLNSAQLKAEPRTELGKYYYFFIYV